MSKMITPSPILKTMLSHSLFITDGDKTFLGGAEMNPKGDNDEGLNRRVDLKKNLQSESSCLDGEKSRYSVSQTRSYVKEASGKNVLYHAAPKNIKKRHDFR